MPALCDVVAYTNEFLRIREIQDWPNALNGLQIENSGRFSKIGAAVDVSTQTIRSAVERKIDFLVVHHGLFWSGLRPITGSLQRILRMAFENDLALYGVHLPLDLHPEVGNSALLAASLGFKTNEAFFEIKGEKVGLKANVLLTRDELLARLHHSLGREVKSFPAGTNNIRNLAIITGGAGSEIQEVAAHGIDTFITGEAPHWAAIAAQELGINLFLGGHYATETFGVKALAAHLAARFKVTWEFLDFPTGL